MIRSGRRTGRHQSLRTITVLAPLPDDAVAQTEHHLERLGDGSSPFALSERTHFARLLVLPERLPPHERPQGMPRHARILDRVTHLGRPQRPDSFTQPYLLFSAGYDDPAAGGYDQDHTSYVLHLRRRLGPAADDIWSTCVGYPGWRHESRFARFFAERSLRAGYVFTPPESAGLMQVRAALQLRRRIIDLAVRTQDASPAEFRRQFDGEFPPTATTPTPNTEDNDPLLTTPPEVSVPDDWPEWDELTTTYADRYVTQRRIAANRTPPDLTDVQGLTVGYPTFGSGAFIFLRIVQVDRARKWLSRVEVTTAAQAHAVLTVARSGAAPPQCVARHVAITHRGLRALGIDDDTLAGFDRAFTAGMALRESALAPGLGVAPWQRPYRPHPAPQGYAEGRDQGIDVLLHVIALDREQLEIGLSEVSADLARSHAFEQVTCEVGHRLFDPHNLGTARPRHLEHFGFTDGISQPVIEGLGGIAPATLPTGELLLGYRDVDGDTAGATAPPELAFNGCYLVFRKLEQDVPGFREFVGDAEEKVVGRRRDGVPLRPFGERHRDFRFQAEDPNGIYCPVGAHVRRVNPRDSRPLLAAADDVRTTDDHRAPIEPRLTRRHRMLRRGITYGEPFPADGDRGLLFVALVADIGRQFEFVQTQWMNDGHAFRLGSDPDVFAAFTGPERKITVQGHPPRFVQLPRPVITCRGGEYFLLPGVRALRNLGTE